MKQIKAIFKSLGGRVWFFVSIVVLTVLIVTNCLTIGTYRSICNTVLGGKRPILDPTVEVKYKSEYKSKADVLEAGNKLNVQIEQEGAVLLLNEEIEKDKKSLPLAKGAKVSVFGHNSVDIVLSGSGSGSGGSSGAKTIFDGLEAGGFRYNETLKKFYESGAAGAKRSTNPVLSEGSSSAPTLDIGETPVDKYTSEVKASFKEYNDAAIVVISRIGGEGFDLPREQNVKNGGLENHHYLQLDKNEYDMLDMVTSRFDNVVVLLNTLTSFQLDFIAEYNNTVGYNQRIDSVVWIGGPGISGAEAIGSLLNGDVTPSGKTADIYARDFTKDPTWQNFGDNSQAGQSAAFTENGSDATDYMVAYEEGVYVGYRYYETRAYEEGVRNGNFDWYEENVIYPFGYGLSYTTFTQEMTVTETKENGKVTGYDIKVDVANVGNEEGKEVVQLYVTLPYTYGGIEKSRVQLVDYAKTDILKTSGEESKATVNFHVDLYDLASYDYNDANANGHFGYEVEAGDYTFYAAKNSHVDDKENVYSKQTVELAATNAVKYTEDPKSGKPVANIYTEETMSAEDKGKFLSADYRLSDVVFSVGGEEYERKGMSRADFEATFPKASDAKARTYLDGEKAALDDRSHNNSEVAEEVKKDGYSLITGAKNDIMLRELHGLDYGAPEWKELLDQLTYNDMVKLANYGAFQTEAIMSIGKNLTNDSDGPVGFVNFMPGLSEHYKGNPSFACEIVIASTFNKDLAYRMGQLVGESGLYGDEGGNGLPYTGWYAPAVNIHRSPFSGRNYEYYSEDPILSGKMAVNVINGAGSKGVYTDLKHFAVNDQETNRQGVATYLTEQSLREIYLKPFEIAVKGNDDPAFSAKATKDIEDNLIQGFKGSTGMMSSFNRIGTRWTGGDYRLLTTILRDEWGFKGVVISDYITVGSLMPAKQAIYAGNDLILTSTRPERWNDSSESNPEDMYVLRKAAHNILYAVANSNSVNAEVLGYKMELWLIALIVIDCAVVAAIPVWGYFAIKKALKKQKAIESNNQTPDTAE